MAFVMVALWLVALILLALDWKSEKTRWIAFIPFCGSFGAFAETIKDNIRTSLIKRRIMNFGLGLTHGYNIMRQQNGYLEISSTEGNETNHLW